MSTDLPQRPSLFATEQRSYALVVSEYNGEFTGALAAHARTELLTIEPGATIDRFDVPGAFEIPLVVNLLAKTSKYHAILALGVIIKGETAHADLIAAAITQSLLTTSLANDVPIIHEVLLVADTAQAQARCLAPGLNRGVEAARAAASAARVVHTIIST